jgi:hypothetical protein
VKPSTTFTISKAQGNGTPKYFLHEQCCYSYGDIRTVRSCLEEHLAALRERSEALQTILAGSDPENAERMLMDQVSVVVNEVTLRPRPGLSIFEKIMEAHTGASPYGLAPGNRSVIITVRVVAVMQMPGN